ncbi:hypothetical protein ACH4ZU_07720 [Streptomyces sp. NPDC020472]|uniref:hypothetical protein n=1 Tax=Streptomyces sp. NPDC020472 TaxID=3365075 RepID=UPI0037A932B5
MELPCKEDRAVQPNDSRPDLSEELEQIEQQLGVVFLGAGQLIMLVPACGSRTSTPCRF